MTHRMQASEFLPKSNESVRQKDNEIKSSQAAGRAMCEVEAKEPKQKSAEKPQTA